MRPSGEVHRVAVLVDSRKEVGLCGRQRQPTAGESWADGCVTQESRCAVVYVVRGGSGEPNDGRHARAHMDFTGAISCLLGLDRERGSEVVLHDSLGQSLHIFHDACLMRRV
jgi:hypothetical protein